MKEKDEPEECASRYDGKEIEGLLVNFLRELNLHM